MRWERPELEDASAGAHGHTKAGPMSFAPFYAYDSKRPRDFDPQSGDRRGAKPRTSRFFAHFGAEVVDLKRLSFGGIDLNNLPTGKVRFLERSEYASLREFLDALEKAEK